MVKLIKYFNEKYGNEYGNIDYPRTTAQMYQAYQIIKSYSIQDYKLLSLLNDVVLPKPKTVKEKEMFSECLYEVSNNGVLLNDLIYKRTPFLKLTKDDFDSVETEAATPLSIIKPEVTSMDEPVSFRKYFYKLTPKLDWLNSEKDFERLGYRIKVKILYEEGETIFNEVEYPFENYAEINNVISSMANGLRIANNGYFNDEKKGLVEENCLYIELAAVPDFVTELELELFKIDSIPTLPSGRRPTYYLVMDADGKLYKKMEVS